MEPKGWTEQVTGQQTDIAVKYSCSESKKVVLWFLQDAVFFEMHKVQIII